MTNRTRPRWSPPGTHGFPTAHPARGGHGDAPDPWWWVVPLGATVAAPLLAGLAARTDSLFAPGSFLFAGSLAASLALILPAWFGARTRRRRPARVGLGVSGCVLALGFPLLVATVGWGVLLVMLLTGNITA
ncbi:hypothetical protein [Streptomyces sp. NPDC053755]|uniref:hypothetical protein n=1 Tax=Streptomyces sp. NPDC053755 TaxID=3155815 RepID=UPI00343E0443